MGYKTEARQSADWINYPTVCKKLFGLPRELFGDCGDGKDRRQSVRWSRLRHPLASSQRKVSQEQYMLRFFLIIGAGRCNEAAV